MLVKFVSVGFDCQHGLFAHPVVNQKIKMRSSIGDVATFIVVEQRPVADELPQGLMTNDSQVAKMSILGQNFFQQAESQILGVEPRNPEMFFEKCLPGLGVLFVKQVENRTNPALRYRAVIIRDIGYQIGDMTAFGLFVTGDN